MSVSVCVRTTVCLFVLVVTLCGCQGAETDQNEIYYDDPLLYEEVEGDAVEDLPLQVANNLDLTLQKSSANVFTKSELNINDTIDTSQSQDYVKKLEQVFATSFFVTIMSEFGDKTFFLSAILAMRHSRAWTFVGTTIGQTIMTLVAVVCGMAASLIPQLYTQWASAIIMTFFGLKMLKESIEMDENADNLELDKDDLEKDKTLTSKDSKKDENENVESVKENGAVNHVKEANEAYSKQNGVVSEKPKDAGKPPENNKGVMLQALTLCLMGEWGDKSQIATILLASNEDPYAVAAGGIVGHILCNVVAVFGGRMLASRFPVKTVCQLGGVCFLLAAASTLFFD